jgi:hypothetical protein
VRADLPYARYGIVYLNPSAIVSCDGIVNTATNANERKDSEMSGYQSEMQKIVEGFVGQLSDLYRRAVTDALGGSNGKSNGKRNGHSNGNGRVFGEKRSSEEMEALATKFVEFVSKNPGLRIEQINKEIGTTTKDLALPIRKLLADGAVKAKGQKRSTVYHPGSKKS